MHTIYKVGGTLNKGFIGQISYTVSLEREYQSMDITFSFDKQLCDTVTEELKSELSIACKENLCLETISDEQVAELAKELKTEIHTIVTMNDIFIGGVHKQLTTRHMVYSPEETSEGCIPQANLNGVVKVTLVVFNVLQDDTRYALSLAVQEQPNQEVAHV